jgi:hypothetical protein
VILLLDSDSGSNGVISAVKEMKKNPYPKRTT